MTGQDLRKLVMLLNNVSADDLCEVVYGKHASKSYVAGKAAGINDPEYGVLRWLSNLDGRNMQRLADLAAADWRAGKPLPDGFEP